MKNKKSLMLLLLVIGGIGLLGGLSYAFFNYSRTGDMSEVTTGPIRFESEDDTDGITLTNMFPISDSVARTRDDNTIEFTLSGINGTYDKDLWYEIDLVEGESISGKTRINPEDLEFELVEVNGTEEHILRHGVYKEFNNRRIYYDKIDKSSTESIVVPIYTYNESATEEDILACIDAITLYNGEDDGFQYETLCRGERNEFFDIDIIEGLAFLQNYLSTDDFNGLEEAMINTVLNKEVKYYIFNENLYDYKELICSEDDTECFESLVNPSDTLIEETKSEIVYAISSGYANASELVGAGVITETTEKNIKLTPVEMERKFKLRMWVNSSTLISDTDPNADYTTDEYENLFGNIKVRVIADFESDFVEISKNNFRDAIYDYDDVLTKISFLKDSIANVTTNYNNASIKGELDKKGIVKWWLEDDTVNTGKYILKVVSPKTIYLNDCAFIFEYFTALEDVDFSNLDTSNVTDMSNMFYNCTSLINLDLSDLNTSNVINMSEMFGLCNSLESLNLEYFDTSRAIDISSMFTSCLKIENLDVSHFDTSNVTKIDGIFSYCEELTNIDLKHWNTSLIEDFSNMFFNCTVLTELDLSHFDTSSAINMTYMFDNCTNLVSLNLSNWNTSNVTDMSWMFAYCDKLTSVNLSGFDTSNVTDMGYMFTSCDEIKTLDLSNWDVSNVTDMGGMFWADEKLKTIYVGSNWNTSKVTNSFYMFNGCLAIVGGNGTTYNGSHIDVEYGRVDTASTPGYLTLKTI